MIKNKLFGLKAFLGLLIASSNAHAASSRVANDFDYNPPSSSAETSIDSNCERLMELEEQPTITDLEFAEGQLLYEMISQIEDSPLEYCTLSAMKAQGVLGGGGNAY